jgi:hypothetical protein
MATTLEKLNESHSVYVPPLEVEKQFALWWAYQRNIAELLRLEEENKKLRKLVREKDLALQLWVLGNPTAEAKKAEEFWKQKHPVDMEW